MIRRDVLDLGSDRDVFLKAAGLDEFGEALGRLFGLGKVCWSLAGEIPKNDEVGRFRGGMTRPIGDAKRVAYIMYHSQFSPLLKTSLFLRAGLLLTAIPLMGGCVAMSIPSQRDHDPADHGGIFGDWRGMTGDANSHPRSASDGSGHRFVGDSCSGDCFGPCETCDQYAPEPAPPEIPWPRFHPVPTRPVFGGPAGTEMLAP